MNSNLRGLALSAVRIIVAVFLLGGLLSIAAIAYLRQPTLSKIAYGSDLRARPSQLRQDVAFLTTDALPRNAAHPEKLDLAAAYVLRRFRDSGGRVSEQQFEARRRTWRNVLAEFGPSDTSLPLVVVGAHYDAFGETGGLPGADDNASGTAGLLELARLFGTSQPPLPVVLVAYTTEEPPFFGSDAMGSSVHARSLKGRLVWGMICLEMIGYFSNKQPWPSWVLGTAYPDRGNFIAVAGRWEDRQLVRHLKRAMRGAGGLPVYSFTGPAEMLDASDHINYWAAGYPAVMVSDTAYLRNPYYHTRNDTAETLDYEKMARVVDGVFNAIMYSNRL